MKKPDHKAVIAKDYTVIDKMARYSLQELRLIAFCLSHYDSRKSENRLVKAHVNDLQAIYPSMDKKSAYDVIRDTMIKLNKSPLEFRNGKTLCFRNWFTGFDYTPGTGEFTFMISPDLQPFLLELEGTFTRYRLQDVYQFRSATTWKLYEQLKKCYEQAPYWAIDLPELKIKLGIPNKYTRWMNFKVRVIDPAMEAINNHSDISVTFTPKKEVRKIIGLVFFVTDKTDRKTITQENPKDTILRLLLQSGVNEKTAHEYTKKIVADTRIEFFVDKIPEIKKRWALRKKGTLSAYLIGTLKKELAQPELPFPKPKHKDALECWQSKRKVGEECKVRVRGKAGQRKKCQICLEKLPVDMWGY